METFILFPYQLNKKNINWVPPLLLSQRKLFDKKHLFWQHNPHKFFLAFREGRCAGRISAFINKEHNLFHKSEEGFFGFLESENDINVFEKLLQASEEFVKSYNSKSITGPMNPSLHYELGVLVNGFEEPPYFMLSHNYNYYDSLINLSGYSKLKDFYSYKLDSKHYEQTEKMQRVNTYLRKKYNVNIRTASLKDFESELEILYNVYNDAFIGHWGFTPIEKNEFNLLAKDMKAIVDPNMILIAEIDSIPVAFILCVPNLNEILIKVKNGRLFPFGIFKILAGKKKIKTVRVITAAVKKAYMHLGIGALLYPEILKRGLQFNYPEGELSWVVEDNFMMNHIAKDLEATCYKTYRIYSKIF